MRLWYRLNQSSLWGLLKIFFRFRAYGTEHIPRQGPVLFVSNHQSYLDPMLCGVPVPRELDYVARDSLFKNRFFARLISSVNAFPIQRDQADLAAIRSIIARLQQGRAIVLFPEGTRTGDGRISVIKSGFDLIARKAQAAVVPLVIDGAFEAWPRTQKLPSPRKIRVLYGPAWSPEQIRRLGREEFVLQVNQCLRDLQSELRRRFGKTPFVYEPLTLADAEKNHGE